MGNGKYDVKHLGCCRTVLHALKEQVNTLSLVTPWLHTVAQMQRQACAL